MHKPVRDNLEEYLRSKAGGFEGVIPRDMEQHLSSCRECAEELGILAQQAGTLRMLRADAEPRPGFYARVIQRIDDARQKSTIWAAFLEPAFARRIVFASVALVLLLGTYLVSTEPGASTVQPAQTVIEAQQSSPSASDVRFDDGTPAQERDAVLVNLASYQE